MRILITGQAGTKKKLFAETMKKYVLAKRGISPTHPASKKEIQWFEVENEEWLGTDFRTFLTDYDERTQDEKWSKALQAINRKINTAKPKDSFLLIHTTWYRNGRFFSPLSWDDLLLYQPDCIITLIDDLYDVWQRIEDGPHDTHVSLDEVLAWRSVEIENAKVIARNLKLNPQTLGVKNIPSKMKGFFGPPVPHFIMSVKHSPETFFRLMFERSRRPVVYASFPITRTRSSAQRRDDINSFRDQLGEAGAIVVDPLTIDEMRMDTEHKDWLRLKNDTYFNEYQGGRWKINNPTVPPPDNYKNPFRDLSDEQITRVGKGIQQHVVDRDFRLVAQCEQLIAYRPFYPEKGDAKLGEPSRTSTGGVTREVNFALRTGKSVWAFHPRSDWCIEQDKNFFERLEVWERVRRFPGKDALASIPAGDFSGFDIILSELRKKINLA